MLEVFWENGFDVLEEVHAERKLRYAAFPLSITEILSMDAKLVEVKANSQIFA